MHILWFTLIAYESLSIFTQYRPLAPAPPPLPLSLALGRPEYACTSGYAISGLMKYKQKSVKHNHHNERAEAERLRRSNRMQVAMQRKHQARTDDDANQPQSVARLRLAHTYSF